MNFKRLFSTSIYKTYILCLYIPIYIQLGWYCLLYKSKPTILWKTNPSFPYGGMICPKSQIFALFDKQKKNANFFINTLVLSARDNLQEKIKKSKSFLKQNKIKYPLILKPDDGVGGIGLYFIENEQELTSALSEVKKNYILQEYISWSDELSVFFIKQPGDKKGVIWSITKRYTIKHYDDPELMIPTRKIIFKDESHRINPLLTERFNAIADIPGFYFGRFDIRVKDIDTFVSEAKDFKILEVNVGAHSIALHAFDNDYSRIKRYKIFGQQLKYAFEIARKNGNHTHSYPNQNFIDFLKEGIGIFNTSK